MAVLNRKPILFDAAGLEAMQACARDFSHYGELPPGAFISAPDSLFDPLKSELATHLEPRTRQRICNYRSYSEKIVLDVFMASSQTQYWLERPGDFRKILAHLNRALTSNTSNWRGGLVGFAPDKAGHAIVFPSPALVPKQIELLRHVLAQESKYSSLVRAALASTLLINAHPFTDGNGRLSRLLFNFVLRQAGMPASTYLPLYEIGWRSHGGYEIALRRAEIFDNWQPLISYFGHVLDICQHLMSQKNSNNPLITVPG